MGKKPNDYFHTGLSKFNVFTKLKKTGDAPSTTVWNRKWIQPFMVKKVVMMLVLRKQTDAAKNSRASTRATLPMNDLKRAFTGLKSPPPPCYIVFLEEVQQQCNMTHRTTLLNYQTSSKHLQDLHYFSRKMKGRAACIIPGCGHRSMLVCGFHSVANDANETNCKNAFADGGEEISMTQSPPMATITL
jgi:hypothetical protein